ncbi:efflux RND transporter periplasmic adaptor subunit, partial [Nocardioides sp.]|uniref:efflux RND transporter periplasmic adaptor subunit n=1 Tax=Nocardioides sp. TaxID=35761 RepID=UPI002F2AD5D1
VRQLEVGQEAAVTPAGAERSYAARVSAISALPDTSTGSTTYAVTVTLDKRGLALPAGATATVDVVVGSAQDVVSVPASAVRDGTVTVLRDGTASTTPVTTGLVGASRIEVTDGLEAGDEIVVADLSAEVPTGDTSGGSGLGGFRPQIGTGPAGPGGGPVTFQR